MKKPSKFKQGSIVSYVAHVLTAERERKKKYQQGTTAASRHLLINKK